MHPATSEKEWNALRAEQARRLRTRRLLLGLLGLLFSCWVVVPDAAGATVFRQQLGKTFRSTMSSVRDLLQVLFGSSGESKGVTTVATDPCTTVSGLVGGFSGTDGFCRNPDGGSVGMWFLPDGGGPVGMSASRCPNGPECGSVDFQRTDGGSGIEARTGATASPAGSYSCVWHGRTQSTATQYALAKYNATATFVNYVTGGVAGLIVYKAGGGSSAVQSAASTIATGAWTTVGFSYTYVADGTSLLSLYLEGASAGTPVTTGVGPLAASTDPIEVGGRILATNSPFWGDISFAACSEAAWTAAQHAAIATAMRANWTEQVTGNGTTFTRASVAYCDPLDGGYGSWLASGVPCIVGGAYLSEPAATNLAINSEFPNGISDCSGVGFVAASGLSWIDGTTTTGIRMPDAGQDSYCYKAPATAGNTVYRISAYVHMDDGGVPTFTSTATAAGTDFAFVVQGNALPSGGSGTVYSVTPTVPGLYRVATTVATDGGPNGSANAGIVKYATNSPATFTFTGVQFETGAISTTYIKNAGTALTRAATVAWVDGGTAGLSLTEGCAAFCVTPGPSGITPSIGRFIDANAAGTARLGYVSGAGGTPGAYDGTHIAGSAVVVWTPGSKQCFRTHWSAAANILGIDIQDGGTSGLANTAFTTFPSFGSGVFIGGAQSGTGAEPNVRISDVRLGSSANGCQ